MSTPAKAREPRPVQVKYLSTSVLVEYVPARIERPRAKKAQARADKVEATGDLEQMRLALIDWLAEILTGWSHLDNAGKPTAPSREALARQPGLWLGAAAQAVGADIEEFSKELAR